MRHVLQPNAILQTTETVERWECDLREYVQRSGKTLDEDVKIGVILAVAPPQVQNYCHMTSHFFVKNSSGTTLQEYCRAQSGYGRW